MEIGITTNSFTGLETETALSKLDGAGAQVCGAGLKTFYEYRPEFAKKYASVAGGVKINSVSVAPQNFEHQLFDERRRVRGDGFYWLDQVMRSAQYFGAKNYVFRGCPQNSAYDVIAERLREISDFCSRYGVTLCLENDSHGLCCYPGIFGALKQRCQSIAAVFNYGKAKNSCYPYQAYLVEMGAHLAEVRIDAGENCAEVIGNLKKQGFDGAVLLDTGRDPTQAIEYIKSII